MFARLDLRSFAVATLLSVSSFAGCGGDPVGLEGDPISEAEIQAIFSALGGAFSSLSNTPAQASAVPGGPAAVSVSQSFDTSVPCARGGAIDASGDVSGNVDDETFASDLRFELTLEPSGCVVATEDGTITVDGSPNVRFEIDSAFSDASISMDGSQAGGLRFTTSDGRTGVCGIDVAFSTVIELGSTGTAQQAVSGTICGVSAEQFSVIPIQ